MSGDVKLVIEFSLVDCTYVSVIIFVFFRWRLVFSLEFRVFVGGRFIIKKEKGDEGMW